MTEQTAAGEPEQTTAPTEVGKVAEAPKKKGGFVAWAKTNRRWALLTIPVAFIIGIAFGGAGAGNVSEIEALEAELSDVRVELQQAKAQVSGAEGAAERAEAEATRIREESEAREAEFAEREAELTAREAAADQVDAEVAARSFGSGTWLVGVDIEAGTYRTTASGCYWERLSGLGGGLGDIIANDFADGSSVVTIAASDLAFSSSGCGTWERID